MVIEAFMLQQSESLNMAYIAQGKTILNSLIIRFTHRTELVSYLIRNEMLRWNYEDTAR